MKYGEQDIDAMLAEFGSELTYRVDGQPYLVLGIVDEVESDMVTKDAATFAGRVIAVQVKTGSLPSIGEGATLELEGASYTVVQTRLLDDGALTQLNLI